VISLSSRAERQIAALADHYRRLQRPEAITRLADALEEATRQIQESPIIGSTAPRPYPQATKPGVTWVKVGRYWFAYRQHPNLVITAIFYDAANIPGRL
jgi:plasmid stabilization system protein ParE